MKGINTNTNGIKKGLFHSPKEKVKKKEKRARLGALDGIERREVGGHFRPGLCEVNVWPSFEAVRISDTALVASRA